MDWVKSLTGYYRLLPIATGTDAMEVMFKRADALAGEIGDDGFIPDEMLPMLTRRPSQAKKIAAQLVSADLWVRVRGGYLIVDWVSINAELVALQAKRKRERDRKRASRAASRESSADASAESPADGPVDSLLDHQSETQTETETAAAAAVPAVARDLPPAVAILRGQLEAHRIVVQWSNLTSDELAEIERLAALHGDNALVQSAIRSYQPNRPPATAKAWLRQWRDLRAPGDLVAVPPDPCPEPGHSGTTKHCVQCASEQKAANR